MTKTALIGSGRAGAGRASGALAALLALSLAVPAAAGGLDLGLPAVSGYLEESLAGQATAEQNIYYLLSHLRLRVDFPEQEGLSARGEFDLYGLGTQPFSLSVSGGNRVNIPATSTAAAVDRLYFRLAGGDTQATIGRQRIPWGNGTAFAPADFFNPPNPVDPKGPRQGADGVMVRRALGPLGYVAAAAAYVNPGAASLPGMASALLTAGGSGSSAGGLSGSVKAATHLGQTDLGLGWGYDAANARHVAFAEAQGDLGVGWHAALARLWSDADGEKWSGAAGVDYSFGGKYVGMLEYAAGPLPGDVGLDGQPRENPRWAVGANYLASEVASLGAHVLLDTAPGAPSTAVVTFTQTLTSALDLSLRLAYPFGEASGAAALWGGAGEVKVRYSF
ncbi:MAG: hypothetical protein QME79_06825 [Bacillota bacterium]|nr:hypothetical protein [Bacillota bacterium]